MNARAETASGIGGSLRALRQGRGLTLAALADQSGVPASTISKIENGTLTPSLVHVINLAAALGANLGFLTGRPAADAPVTTMPADRRPRLALEGMGIVLEDLHGGFDTGVLEARLGTLAPGARSGEDAMTHPGEEVCHVLQGAIRYRIEGAEHCLGPGDTIHFRATAPHHWENAQEGPTRVIWVFSDGLSF